MITPGSEYHRYLIQVFIKSQGDSCKNYAHRAYLTYEPSIISYMSNLNIYKSLIEPL